MIKIVSVRLQWHIRYIPYTQLRVYIFMSFLKKNLIFFLGVTGDLLIDCLLRLLSSKKKQFTLIILWINGLEYYFLE